MSDVFGILLMF